MRVYKLRLTVTFVRGLQWKLGMETEAIGELIAVELASSLPSIAHICLSDEKSGQVKWLQKAEELRSRTNLH